MKRIIILTLACIAFFACTNYPKVESSMPYKVKNGVYVLKEPKRAPGQETMIGFAAEPMETVRIGVVGTGSRGRSDMMTVASCEGVQIVAVCDKYEDHVKLAQEKLTESGRPAAREYVGADAYKELCACDDIDMVYVTTDWVMHATIALCALENGKHTAIEVPSAMTVKECWDLVDASERNRKHCIIMENCCYNKTNMLILNLVQQGILGEVYQGCGAYIHNLERFWKNYTDNWRLAYNQAHRGDNYTTHGFGPECMIMGINRGDKMERLVSVDSKPFHGAELAKEIMGTDEFADGEHTTTLITTAKGHTMEIQHNVYTPRAKTFLNEFTGTRGYAGITNNPEFNLDSKYLPDKEIYQGLDPHQRIIRGSKDKDMNAVLDALFQDFKHPIYAENEEMAMIVGGHGGMDYVLNARIIYCLRNGLPMDMDVYDLAAQCCPVELSEISLNAGNMPVAVPDFTRGDWNLRQGQTFAKKQ